MKKYGKTHGIIALIAVIAFLASACASTGGGNPQAQTHLNNGKQLFDQGKYDEAILELTSAISLAPELAEAYAYRSRSYNGKNDYDQGLADANEAIRLNPQLALGHFTRGRAYSGKNNHDEAIADYTEAIRLNPQFALAYNNRGILHHDKKDYDNAIADYTEAIKLDPTASRYVNRGLVHNNKRDYDSAIADYTEAIRLDPQYALAYNNRGVAHQDKREYDRAIADYTEAIRLDPQYALAYANRGNAHRNSGNNTQATADYEAALRINPDSATAKDGLEAIARPQMTRVQTFLDNGIRYFDAANYNAAITELTEAIRLDPNLALAYAYRARAYNSLRNADFDRALTDANAAIRLNPQLALGYFARGRAYEGKNDNDRAIADYEEALRLDPNNANAKRNLAALQDQQRQMREQQRQMQDQQSAPALRSGVAVSGNLSAGGEVWYRFTPATSGYLLAQTTGNTHTHLEVFDTQNKRLTYDTYYNKQRNNSRISAFSIEAGRTYLIKVRGYDSSAQGPYSITATVETEQERYQRGIAEGTIRETGEKGSGNPIMDAVEQGRRDRAAGNTAGSSSGSSSYQGWPYSVSVTYTTHDNRTVSEVIRVRAATPAEASDKARTAFFKSHPGANNISFGSPQR